MTERTVHFKVDSCRISLNLPEAVTGMSVTKIRKIMKFVLSRCWNYEDEERNRESALQFFHCVPEVQDDLESRKKEAAKYFAEHYRDEKFDSHGHIRSKKDATSVKRANKVNYAKVMEAQRKYEAFIEKTVLLMNLKKEYFEEEE